MPLAFKKRPCEMGQMVEPTLKASFSLHTDGDPCPTTSFTFFSQWPLALKVKLEKYGEEKIFLRKACAGPWFLSGNKFLAVTPSWLELSH